MKKLLKNEMFLLGFFSGTVLFFFFNYLSFTREQFTCDDCTYQYGFPFYLYEEGGFVTIERFIWAGVFLDILIAIIFSFILGLIFKFIWSKFAERKLK